MLILHFLDLLAHCTDVYVYVTTLLGKRALFPSECTSCGKCQLSGIRFVFSSIYWHEIVLLLALVDMHATVERKRPRNYVERLASPS